MNLWEAFRGGWMGGLIVLLGTLPSVALAQGNGASRAEARVHFDLGVAAFESGAYQEALREFEAAYRIAPHPSVKVNIANCHEQLGNPVAALSHFEEFLEESQSPGRAQQRQVERAIERLTAQVSSLQLTVEPAGASVRIDGQRVAPSTLTEPIRLATGSHTIEARATGFLTGAQEFTLEAGVPLELALRLEAAPVTEPEVDTPPPTPLADDPNRNDEAWGLAPIQPLTVAIGATSLAAAAAAGIIALFAAGAEDDFEAADRIAQDPLETPTNRLLAFNQSIADADRANDLSLVADGIGLAAAAGVITTGVLAVMDVVNEEETDAPPGDSFSNLTLEPSVGVSPTGLAAELSLQF